MTKKSLLAAGTLLFTSASYSQEKPLNLAYDITPDHVRSSACYSSTSNTVCFTTRAQEKQLVNTLQHTTNIANARVRSRFADTNNGIRITNVIAHRLGNVLVDSIDGRVQETSYDREFGDWRVAAAYRPQDDVARFNLQKGSFHARYTNAQKQSVLFNHNHSFSSHPITLQSSVRAQLRPRDEYSLTFSLHVRF